VPTFDSPVCVRLPRAQPEEGRGGWNGSRYDNPEVNAKIKSLATNRSGGATRHRRDLGEGEEDRVFLMVHNQMLAYAMRDGIDIAVHPENQPHMATSRASDLTDPCWAARDNRAGAVCVRLSGFGGPAMIAYILRRIAQSVLVMLVVALVSFSLFRFVGDPIATMMGQETSQADREALRERAGPERSGAVQFATFIGPRGRAISAFPTACSSR
jgi:hypothetical protein